MVRLLLFLIVGVAVWYGWHHHADLRVPEAHEVVVVNGTDHALERIRVSAGGQTVVVETLEPGATQRVPLRAPRDGTFHLVWASRRQLGEREWSGGTFAHGPELKTYRFEFDGKEHVTWSSAKKTGKEPEKKAAD